MTRPSTDAVGLAEDELENRHTSYNVARRSRMVENYGHPGQMARREAMFAPDFRSFTVLRSGS
jgi:hypothetical protein